MQIDPQNEIIPNNIPIPVTISTPLKAFKAFKTSEKLNKTRKKSPSK